jgi:hypothetical protein
MPREMRRRINDPEPNLYNPPDVYNPFLDPPPQDSNSINVLSIVEGGTEFEPLLYSSRSTLQDVARGGRGDMGDGRGPLEYYDMDNAIASSMPVLMPDRFEPGRGIFLNTVPGTDNLCDGSYTSFCNRGVSNDCLLGGMNDYRGGLHFDCFSGWLIFNVPRIMHGIIMIKLETYHEASPLTKGWTSINNNNNTVSITSEEGKVGGMGDSPKPNGDKSPEERRQPQQRSLQSDTKPKKKNKKKGPPESDRWCDEFAFEYALNGKVTKWNKFEFFDQHLQTIQRTMSIVTLLNDETVDDLSTSLSNVQVAIRMTGCGRNNNNDNNQGFQLTHVYWA